MFFEQFFNYDPWFRYGKDLDNLFNQMGSILTGVPSRTGRRADFPLTNMWSNADKVVMTLEVPGVNSEDISINAMDDSISIEGKREEQGEKESKLNYHRQERSKGNFKRIFRLPYKIEVDKVEAKYEKGILHLTLPRAEEDKPKRIKVSVS